MYRERLMLRCLRQRLASGDVLDAGAGTGSLAISVRESGFRVCALERSLAGLKALIRRARREDSSPSLLAAQADAERIPFIDASFDAVLCGEVLEHLADDAAAVAGFYRVLKPGGICIVTVPAWPKLWTFCDDYAGHYRRYARDALVALFESSGLRILYVGNWGFPLIRLYQRFVFRPYVRRQETAGATSIVAPRRVPSSLAHIAMSITSFLFAVDNLFLWSRWGVGLVLIAEKAES